MTYRARCGRRRELTRKTSAFTYRTPVFYVDGIRLLGVERVSYDEGTKRVSATLRIQPYVYEASFEVWLNDEKR